MNTASQQAMYSVDFQQARQVLDELMAKMTPQQEMAFLAQLVIVGLRIINTDLRISG